MPIYMDRHDIPEEITAEHVALMHQEDLKIQHLYGCKGMTYWCDDQRHTAFCLIEAPNIKAIQEMHNHAHGAVPHQIIEVDAQVVESFLGRIEDPHKAENELLNIINEPAFRVIMVLEASNYLNWMEANQFNIFLKKFHKSVTRAIDQFEGSVAKQYSSTYVASFRSVTKAVLCALKIRSNFKFITPESEADRMQLKVGISAGSPVDDKDLLFAEVITNATRMCKFVNGQVVISSVVKSQYESENLNGLIDRDRIRSLNPQEELFLSQLMDFSEKSWNNPAFNISTFSRELGRSKSQLYRKSIQLTGKSPNVFIREFRLQKALNLLRNQTGTVSEIAFKSGFNSPAYFSKCFVDTFGILPSKYVQQHTL